MKSRFCPPLFAALLLTAAAEFLVSLPCLVLVFPLFRQVHRRTTVDY